jgi:hypothetical protein
MNTTKQYGDAGVHAATKGLSRNRLCVLAEYLIAGDSGITEMISLEADMEGCRLSNTLAWTIENSRFGSADAIAGMRSLRLRGP